MRSWYIKVVDVIAEAVDKFMDYGFWGNREIKLLTALLLVVTGAQTYFHDTFSHG
jgi:hypothetical protein